jgi:hypothetical protein
MTQGWPSPRPGQWRTGRSSLKKVSSGDSAPLRIEMLDTRRTLAANPCDPVLGFPPDTSRQNSVLPLQLVFGYGEPAVTGRRDDPFDQTSQMLRIRRLHHISAGSMAAAELHVRALRR